MHSYILRRLAFGAVAVVGVSIVVFVVLRILPGDPLVAIFGPEGFSKLSEAERALHGGPRLERPAAGAVFVLGAGHIARRLLARVLLRRERGRHEFPARAADPP